MTDDDWDDYGDDNPGTNVEAGTDCDDSDQYAYPESNDPNGIGDSCVMFVGNTGNRIGQSISTGAVQSTGQIDVLVGSTTDGTTAYLLPESAGSDPWFDSSYALTADEDDVGHATTIADFDDEDYEDLAISAHKWNGSTGQPEGRVYVVYGPITGDVDLETDPDVTTISGETEGDRVGFSLAAIHQHGETQAQLLVGAAGSFTGTGGGAVHLVTVPTSASALDIPGDSEVIWEAESDNDRVGSSLAVGDGNGDGDEDFLVGAKLADDTGAQDSGKVYFVASDSSWSSTSIFALQDSEVIFYGDEEDGEIGHALDMSHDLTNGGYPTVVITSTAVDSGAGAVYLFDISDVSTACSGVLPCDVSMNVARVTITGDDDDDFLGSSVTSGDWDGDGDSDLLVSAEGSGSDYGAVHIFYGPFYSTQTLTSASATGSSGLTLPGEEAGDRAGSALHLESDVGGGVSGLFVGAHKANSDSGAVYMLFGQ